MNMHTYLCMDVYVYLNDSAAESIYLLFELAKERESEQKLLFF